MPATKPSKVSEVYEKVTAHVVRAIREGIADPKNWKAPWTSTGAYPTNAATGNQYQGGNVIWFQINQLEAGYATAYWATYKQWTELGRQVEKDQHGTLGIKWVFPEKEKIVAAKAAGQPAPHAFPNTFTVFNFAQTVPVEGAAKVWEPPKGRESSEVDDITRDFIAKVGADVRFGADGACFIPAFDRIELPSPENFTSPEAFCSTAAHEHTHWTGHKDRLDRDLNNRFGTEAYAAEELVAELGAAFTCGRLGICSEPREDHAHYLKNWLTVLSNDEKALYHAASLAQKAVEFLFERAEHKQAVAA